MKNKWSKKEGMRGFLLIIFITGLAYVILPKFQQSGTGGPPPAQPPLRHADSGEPPLIAPSESERRSTVPTADQQVQSANPFDEVVAIGRRDLAAAIAYVKAHFSGKKEQEALGYLLTEFGKERLDYIPVIWPLITSLIDRESALSHIMDHWIAVDKDGVLRFSVAQKNGALRNSLLRKAVDSFSKIQRFDDARKVIASMPFSGERTGAISSLTGYLVRTDPQQAIAWMAELPLKEDADAARFAIRVHFISERNLDSLIAVLPTADENRRSSELTEIGRMIAEDGVSKLLEVAPKGTKDYEQMLVGAASSAPADSMGQVFGEIREIKDPRLKQVAFAVYAGRLLEQDQQQAVQWLNQVPPDMRPYAIPSLVSSWYHTDSIELSEWINRMPTGNDRDIALFTLSQHLRRTDREAARQAADAISDPAKRERALKSL